MSDFTERVTFQQLEKELALVSALSEKLTRNEISSLLAVVDASVDNPLSTKPDFTKLHDVLIKGFASAADEDAKYKAMIFYAALVLQLWPVHFSEKMHHVLFNRAIKSLDLSNGGFDDLNCVYLSHVLACTNVHVLNLNSDLTAKDSNQIGDEGLEALIKYATTLDELCLRNNNLTAKSAKLLEQSKIKKFDISGDSPNLSSMAKFFTGTAVKKAGNHQADSTKLKKS